MKSKFSGLLSSAISGASKVGVLPYVRYRLNSYFGNKTPMQVKLSDTTISVRPGTPDLRVAFQSLGSEFDLLDGLQPSDFDGLVLDAGGYIGTAAISLSRLFPKATIVSVEPSTRNFQLLQQNTRGFPNIHCLNAALVPPEKSSNKVFLVDRGTGEWGFSIAVGSEDKAQTNELEEVSLISVAEVRERFDNRPIGLIKLDIEGGEYELFKNPDDHLRNIPVVFVELHDRIVEGCSRVFSDFSRDRLNYKSDGEKHLSLLPELVGHLKDTSVHSKLVRTN
ncbi:MAG: FkbM family methyltransferase [Henriciella sp.]|nr:FkbM family methyltransferase [Henriciella sp.]